MWIIKKTVALHNSGSSRLRCRRNSCSEVFQNPQRHYEVKLKTWFLQLFWRWTLQLIFIWNLEKLFKQPFLGTFFCLNFTGDHCFYWYDWFYFSVRPIWSLERVFFDETFNKAWDQNAFHWLLGKFHCAHSVFSLCTDWRL